MAITDTFKRLYARQGLAMLLTAGLLLEATALIQYHFSKQGLRDEADRRAQSEMTVARLRIENTTLSVENDARSLSRALSEKLYTPEQFAPLIQRLMENNEVLVNGFIAMEPDYYRWEGRWFEPVVSRRDNGFETIRLGSAEHDYFNTDWYRFAMDNEDGYWSEPYFDADVTQDMVVTFSVPVKDTQGRKVGVFGVDVELTWLDKLIESVQPYQDAYGTLVSRGGMLLGAPAETLTVDRTLRYETLIGRTGWKMSVVIPEDEIYGGIKRVGLIVTLLQLLGLLLLILIIWRSAREQMKLEEAQAGKEKMENELHIAREIQMSMIPKIFPPFPERHDLDLNAVIVPAKEVGGDLYDFFIRDEQLFFCIGDVSGKGVPASLVMAVSRSLFRTVAGHETSPSRIVTSMNDAMAEINESSMFVTFFCGVLDMASGHMRYCNAGHNAPVMLTDAKRMLPVESNLPLGVMAGFTFSEQETDLSYDDAIFLYTDGLTEAENSAKELFGEERMKAALSGRKSAADHMQAIKQSVHEFVGDAPQSDDLTMLFIHFMNENPSTDRHLVLHNNIQQIPQLADFIETIAVEKNLDQALAMNLNLALEEAVTNVIMYAYPDGADGLVDIEAILREGSLEFVVSDSGRPFDPTARPEADVTLQAEDRPIGGLGIFLVRHIMDKVDYARINGKNVLTMTKFI